MRLQAKRLWITSTPGARRGSVVTAWSYRPRICPRGGRPGGASTSSHPPDRPLLRKEDRTEDHDPVRTAGKTLIDLLAQAVAQGEDRLIVPDRDACGGEGFIERSRDRILVLRRVRQENVVCFLRVIAFRRRSRGRRGNRLRRRSRKPEGDRADLLDLFEARLQLLRDDVRE